jgi:RNA polymerase sigma factor (sigma-70 family)
MRTDSLFLLARHESAKAKDDRRKRLADLYAATAPRVLRFLEHRLADAALAEDLTAEVYARAWAKLWDLSNPDAATAWLFRTARNLATDHARRTRATVPITQVGEAMHPTSTSPEPLVDLASLLAPLQHREREAIALRFVVGLRNREIAGVLGTTEGNVAKLIHRGLRRLRSTVEAVPSSAK